MSSPKAPPRSPAALRELSDEELLVAVLSPTRDEANAAWNVFYARFERLMAACIRRTLGRYTATYGSLATIVVFMTWLWLSAIIVLSGAELNAELEHQSRHGSAPAPVTQLSRNGPG